jgi:hypothetical protein
MKGTVMSINSKVNHERDGHQHEVRSRTRGRVARGAITLTATAALALAAATPAFASGHEHAIVGYQRPAITLVAVTPSPNDVAGAGGVFNVDLAALARNAAGNRELSAANGYKPGINSSPGIGRPDPFAPGLVVLLSTTPQAAGGPDANLAGVFQLTDVASSHGLAQVFADWEVGKPGAFGDGTTTTLTAYLVRGTAQGIVTGSQRPISNVITETFTIGS